MVVSRSVVLPEQRDSVPTLMPLSETVLIVVILLAIAVIAAGLLRNVPIPDSVMLVVIGMVLGELAGRVGWLSALQSFRLSPDLVFFVFLPVLIFESGYNLNARQLVKDIVPILALAVPALLISTALIGIGVHLLLGLDLLTALLFGALISATDPVAVIALFKELGARLRLTVLVEGESLLNDATAIVVFGIVLGLVVGGEALSPAELAWSVLEFLRVFVGGVLAGLAVGAVVGELVYRLRTTLTGVLVMSIVAAYASFIVAEHLLHVSGVMASASAAVTLGALGVVRMPQSATATVGELWEMLALICNALLFLLVGLSVDIEGLIGRIPGIAAALPLVLAARAVSVYGLIPVTVRLFALPRVSLGEQHVMWWGGLKGGLAIAIALSIPEDLPGRQLLLDLTLGVVLFTLLVNAPTIRPLMTRLGLNRLTAEEHAELNQSLVDARRQASGELERFRRVGLLSSVAEHRVGERVRQVLEPDAEVADADLGRREAYRVAWQAELQEVNRLHETGAVTQYTYVEWRSILQRDRERHGESGAIGEPATGGNPFIRLEMAVLRQLREHDRASRLLAWYQNLRLAQHLEYNIAGLMMATAAGTELSTRDGLSATDAGPLVALYETRRHRRRARISTLRSDFPGFFARFESRLFARIALRSAANHVAHALHDGGIGATVSGLIDARLRVALEGLPPVTSSLPRLSTQALINLVPLLAGLPSPALGALAAQARSVTFLPGDRIIEEGDRGDALYVITQGRVRVSRQGQATEPVAELGEGDFFGEAALLGDQVRTATVEAISNATLLRLARRDVMTLAQRSPEIEARLREANAARQQS